MKPGILGTNWPETSLIKWRKASKFAAIFECDKKISKISNSSLGVGLKQKKICRSVLKCFTVKNQVLCCAYQHHKEREKKVAEFTCGTENESVA